MNAIETKKAAIRQSQFVLRDSRCGQIKFNEFSFNYFQSAMFYRNLVWMVLFSFMRNMQNTQNDTHRQRVREMATALKRSRDNKRHKKKPLTNLMATLLNEQWEKK